MWPQALGYRRASLLKVKRYDQLKYNVHLSTVFCTSSQDESRSNSSARHNRARLLYKSARKWDTASVCLLPAVLSLERPRQIKILKKATYVFFSFSNSRAKWASRGLAFTPKVQVHPKTSVEIFFISLLLTTNSTCKMDNSMGKNEKMKLTLVRCLPNIF